jgi:hypothetical protein
MRLRRRADTGPRRVVDGFRKLSTISLTVHGPRWKLCADRASSISRGICGVASDRRSRLPSWPVAQSSRRKESQYCRDRDRADNQNQEAARAYGCPRQPHLSADLCHQQHAGRIGGSPVRAAFASQRIMEWSTFKPLRCLHLLSWISRELIAKAVVERDHSRAPISQDRSLRDDFLRATEACHLKN